uniref:NACHT, LRR and PYD domains-containing protein 3 n=1 Tax=Leptobrachium leishanense TaxID=445787 RepID=A0A8C5PLN5_9ANUR
MATSYEHGLSPVSKSRSTSAILLHSLENLGKEDLKRFRFHLSDFRYEHKRPIARGRLEDADPTKTTSHIVAYYGEKNALDVTYQVFIGMGLRGPAENLQQEQRNTYSTRKMLKETLEGVRKSYKKYVKTTFQRIEDRNARFGESVKLNQRFTKLQMIQTHRDEEEQRHVLMSSSGCHLDVMDRALENYSPTSIKGLFDPDEHGGIPQIVILQGPAGIGKTMTSHKIMLDWASESLYQEKFNYSFYISCREINQIKGNLSIAALISKICKLQCQEHLMKKILEQSNKILFIIDGLDELKFSLEDQAETKIEDPFLETSMGIILHGLLTKQVLYHASLIVTTRPFTLDKLRKWIKCDRYVEIMGFTGKTRKKYFTKFFENKEEAARALNLIKEHSTLFALYSLPITCWIVCTVLKQNIRKGFDVSNYNTSTSIYLLYLKGLLKYHSRDSKLPIITCLKRVSALAKEGMWDQKIIFEEEDLKKHGLNVSDVESTFLNENIFQRDIEIQTYYSFIHLSVQEFFAALYYVLNMGAECREDSEDPVTYSEVRTLLEKVKECLHLSLTVRFLFGLLGEKQIIELTKITQSKVTSGYKSLLEEWIKEMTLKSENHNMILSCLYETQDENVVKKMMSHFIHLNISFISAGWKCDPKHLSYCLVHSENVHTVAMNRTSLSQEDVKILFLGLHKCSSVRFTSCRFLDRRLRFSGTGSKIETLSLRACGLTPSCCKKLRSAIITNRSLIILDLSENKLQDSGVKRLCKGLRHPGCVLQELRLEHCDLSSSCCDDLYFIITNGSLITLDLSWNILQESGVKHLCEGLRDPGCVLRELRLYRCGLTSSSCEDLSSVIIANRTLIKLDLSANYNVQDSGIKRLCKGLMHRNSILRELRLNHCILTSSTCKQLRSVIITNRSLITLDLSRNILQDSGIKHLCEGLRLPDCVLQELRLERCGLTPSCCEDLYSVIITNRSLIKLDLTHNNLEVSGMKRLCEGLRHPDCVLKELGLDSRTINVAEYRAGNVLLPGRNISVSRSGIHFNVGRGLALGQDGCVIS